MAEAAYRRVHGSARGDGVTEHVSHRALVAPEVTAYGAPVAAEEFGPQEDGTCERTLRGDPVTSDAGGPARGPGKENDEIARALNLAPHTVENYVSELEDILEALGRVDLAFKCIGIDS